MTERRKTVRVVLGILWVLFLALYAASKIDFFARYDPLSVRKYLWSHSSSWIAMAVIAFVIWLITKRFPQDGE